MIVARELKQPGIAHGFFGRKGGYSTGIFASLNCGLGSGDDRATVMRNREVVAGTGRQRGANRHRVPGHSADAVDRDRAMGR